jgi:Sulfotransferase domain
MKAIGAGFPRTGTLSTKAALEHLGVGPCYHFVTQFERPQDAEVWLAAARGHPVDWTRAVKTRPRCCSTCAGGWPRRLRGAPWTRRRRE